jgi:hypothetical protein
MKQDKHIKLINKASGTSENLAVAKKAKFDEFYTPYDDIAAELNHYKGKFYGKRIICPCDWDVLKDEDVFSVTVEFGEHAITPTWTVNKVSRVIVRHVLGDFDLNPTIVEEVITGDYAKDLLRDRVKCHFMKYLLSIANECKIKSITASGYDGIHKRGVKFQEVDYSKYDLCLTNPPFSLYKEFMECMILEYDRRDRQTNPFDFIIMAPLTNRNSTFEGIPLFEHKVFLGYNRDTHVLFVNPDQSATHDKKKSVDIDWITTFDDAQKEIDKYPLSTGVTYELYASDFPVMQAMTLKDGSHPIEIKDKRGYPDNYTGWALASIGILNKLSNKYYEWYGMNWHKYYNQTCPEQNPLAHNLSVAMFEGKFTGGILFRRRPETLVEEVENNA